ncbi:acyl-CoA dehydrogenase family protein [Candidimonas nitroreducens]|uniref:Acyl-CoA dehydrogenase n=1 Tax=Candidimonas nitroreducens TaxID=683354 RepID=A0A225MCM3_9BURK|nr:acyl-CoA dehydrogenase family protein [Candidimonas nitroreducens]OWT58986.1 hypothetical protein CEY11_12355 [Candidimonas nitroreducens]
MTERDEIEVLLENSAEDFLSSEFRDERLRNVYLGRNAYDRGFWRSIAQQGWLALRLPETLGGSGLQVRHVGILANAFGRRAVPEPLVACSLIPAVLAAHLGNGRWQEITGALVDGGRVIAVAWQEAPQRLDAEPLLTVAARAGGGYVLNGSKYGVVAGGWADALLVSARLDGEAALFLLPAGSAGLEITERLGSDGGTVALVKLEQACVPAQALLAHGSVVTEALELARDEAMLATALQLCGMAAAGFELTLEYMRTRVQFGRHIGSFQSLQHLAVDIGIQQALTRAACRAAMDRCEAAPGTIDARRAIAAAKARASDTGISAGRFGVQAHGAIGFAAEASIGLYLKGALRLAAYLGGGSQHRRQYRQLADLAQENA